MAKVTDLSQYRAEHLPSQARSPAGGDLDVDRLPRQPAENESPAGEYHYSAHVGTILDATIANLEWLLTRQELDDQWADAIEDNLAKVRKARKLADDIDAQDKHRKGGFFR